MLQAAEFDLAALIDNLLARLQAGFEERSLAVEVRIDRPLPVVADPGKIERALENLVDNARKYAPAGSAVRLVAVAWGRGGAKVVVSNEFEGDPAEVPHLFERFYRRDRSHGGNGSGLGLTIARELAELHGGRLTAEVVAGSLTFTLELPSPHTGESAPGGR